MPYRRGPIVHLQNEQQILGEQNNQNNKKGKNQQAMN